jgi:uncharacterized membrane protein YhiD involved in acid resistance
MGDERLRSPDAGRAQAGPLAVLALVALIGGLTGLAVAQTPQVEPMPAPSPLESAIGEDEEVVPGLNLDRLVDALIALPIATLLGAALALRPRRRGTPKRQAPIVQTQIILAVIGALVMLVVGSSLARAFGVVGAAGLVRYRARIDDPKDAGVMLSTLAVGLASGVGLYLLAVFAAVFVMLVLWVIESFEPEAHKFFLLKIDAKDARALQPQVETVLRKSRVPFELRSSSEDELSFEVQVPSKRGTDGITRAVLAVKGVTAVDWDEQKKKQVADID